MKAVLVPFTEFQPKDLAPVLRKQAKLQSSSLRARGMFGVLARYSRTSNVVTSNVDRAMVEMAIRSCGHYAIVGTHGNVIGAATATRGVYLKRQRLPMPHSVRVSRLPLLSVDQGSYSHRVHAWASDTERLATAYKVLVRGIEFNSHEHDAFTQVDDYDRHAKEVMADIFDTPVNAHAIVATEPVRSIKEVHDAIRFSGLKPHLNTERIDDGSLSWFMPPLTQVYSDGYVSDGCNKFQPISSLEDIA